LRKWIAKRLGRELNRQKLSCHPGSIRKNQRTRPLRGHVVEHRPDPGCLAELAPNNDTGYFCARSVLFVTLGWKLVVKGLSCPREMTSIIQIRDHQSFHFRKQLIKKEREEKTMSVQGENVPPERLVALKIPRSTRRKQIEKEKGSQGYNHRIPGDEEGWISMVGENRDRI